MIKVGIIGAEQPVAGELLRILVHHPEVDIVTLCSPAFAGRHPSACHFGFIGTTVPNFTDRLDPAALNVVFIADKSSPGTDILAHNEKWPKLRIIDLSPARLENLSAFGLEYGLSEINRKPLVRGARMASVPSAVASLSLVALYPLALNLLLNGDIHIDIEAPAAMQTSLNLPKVAAEISTMLVKTQTSFTGKVLLTTTASNSIRGLKVNIRMNCPLSLAEIDRVYDSVYDDHNFTYTSLSGVGTPEVEGTQKCIVSLSKPDAGSLELNAVGDAYLRGGAGDAVHVMNLFFALDEKVGLYLKPNSCQTKSPEGHPQACWFA